MTSFVEGFRFVKIWASILNKDMQNSKYRLAVSPNPRFKP